MRSKQFILIVFMVIPLFFSWLSPHASATALDFGSFRVNVDNDDTQDSYLPQSPMRLGDKLLVYWRDANTFKDFLTVINPDGSIGSLPDVSISPKTNNQSDTILYGELSNGNIVVYWYSSSSGTGLTDTYFKIINSNGNEVVGATKINSSPGELNRFTKFAELSNGNLAFVWATGGSNYALRRFQQNGTPVDEAQLSVTSLAGISGSQYSHDIIANSNGTFMIMISYFNPNYVGMIFNNQSSTPLQVNGQNSFVISSRGENSNEIQWMKVMPNGKFLTVYQKKSGDSTSTRSIAFRIFNEDGTPYANETVIQPLNSWGSIAEPIILEDGGFALVYSYLDYNTNPFTSHSYFKTYSSTGAFQNDLSPSLPTVVAELGFVIPFLDVDGKLSLLINDIEAGDSTYDLWLLRHGVTTTTYTVTFKDWDTTQLKTEKVNHGSHATAPASPMRAGYTFIGWDNTFTNVIQDLIVTARYNVNPYTVNFNSNGGSVISAVNADYGTKITAPAAPTREGYTFGGWFKEAGLTDTWDFNVDTVPVNGVTLYAKWLINAPSIPDNLKTIAADSQVNLQWDSVTGATYYDVYMSTTSGQYSNTPIATVTEATYQVQNLINGTTYYYIVKAGNAGGLSAESNEVSAIPATVPGVPTNVSATAGNGSAMITFTPPTDNGGSAITGYEVISSPGNIVVTGAIPITVTGLTNGTSYTFSVKAINGVGISIASLASNKVTPREPSSNSDDNRGTATPSPTNTGVNILVNGKAGSGGTAKTEVVNGQRVTTIVVDEEKLIQRLEAEDERAVITILNTSGNDVFVGELNGRLVKQLEKKQTVVEIHTDQAVYSLPARQINMDGVTKQFGTILELQDIRVRIEIAAPLSETIRVVENAATKNGFSLLVPPLNFSVKVVYGDRMKEVTRFNTYVERTIAIPEGVDPNKISTGVVVDPDGLVRHVPTKIVMIENKYYAKINSLTDSLYSVVWHPVEFSDVANHWAKNAVNDMGSRMVMSGTKDGIFNPDQEITRAEFAAVIVRGLGLKLENGTGVFSDVKEADWYSSAIITAYMYNLINGFEDGTFRPNDKITREQVMAIIAKAMKITDLKTNASTDVLHSFKDASDVSHWAASGIADSVNVGIVSGRSGTKLAPKAFITRAEVAAIIQRLLQKSELI